MDPRTAFTLAVVMLSALATPFAPSSPRLIHGGGISITDDCAVVDPNMWHNLRVLDGSEPWLIQGPQSQSRVLDQIRCFGAQHRISIPHPNKLEGISGGRPILTNSPGVCGVAPSNGTGNLEFHSSLPSPKPTKANTKETFRSQLEEIATGFD